jgi:hypothetical protein
MTGYARTDGKRRTASVSEVGHRLTHPPTVASGWLRGLVIAMIQQYSRQYVIDMLNRLGYPQLAEEAAHDLPDPVDADQVGTWWIQHGLSRDELISRMGGSP